MEAQSEKSSEGTGLQIQNIGQVQQRVTRSVVKKRKKEEDFENSHYEEFENGQQDVNKNNKQGGKNEEKDCGDWKQKYEELLTMHNDEVKKFDVKVKKLENKVVEYEEELENKVEEYKNVVNTHEELVQKLRDKVQCPVCLDVPKEAPIPVCPNGHVVCNECLRENCPMCRVKMGKGKSSLAVTVLENIDHPCNNEGCQQTVPFGELTNHDKCCNYRRVKCPGPECSQMVSLATLASHIVSGIRHCVRFSWGYMKTNEVFDFEYVSGILDQEGKYKLENEYNEVDAIRFDENLFLLKVFRQKEIKGSGKWIFWVQIVGGEEDASKYGVSIIVHRPREGPDEKYTRRYHGDVCPIDVTTMTEAEEKGLCLSLSDLAVDKLSIISQINQDWLYFSVSVKIFRTGVAVS